MTIEPQPAGSHDGAAEPLGTRERVVSGIVGVVAGGAGGAAVFVTTNGVGSGALLLAAGAFLLMAVTGSPIRSLTFGGAKVDFDPAAEERGKQVAEVVREVDENPELAKAHLQEILTEAARTEGISEPESKAEAVAGWPELNDLANSVKMEAERAGLTVTTYRRYQWPRLVVKTENAEYGIYVQPGERVGTWLLDTAAEAALKIDKDVRPVLAIETRPAPRFEDEASKRSVSVMWRDQGRWTGIPWSGGGAARLGSPGGLEQDPN